MSPSSNSVYSSVFTYNPYVLTRPYRHLTFVASIEPHRITCISHDISVSIDRARACRMDTPSRQKQTRRSSTKVSWLLTNIITHRGCSDSSTYTFSSFLRYCGSFKPFNFTPFSNIVCRIKRSIKQTFKMDCKTAAKL